MKKIEIGDKKIEIRGIKLKEVKQLINNCNDLIDETFAILDSANIVQAAKDFVIKYIDQITLLIAQFTNQSAEEIQEMEIMEIVHLCNELLKYNGVNLAKVYDFFMSSLAKKATSAETINFIQTLPQVN